MDKEIIKKLKIFIRYLKEDLQENIRDNTFTGELSDSIKIEVKKERKNFVLKLSFAEHGIYLDEGTKPHFPPVNEIKYWAQAHNINEWALAHSIAEKGTKEHPWLYTFEDAMFDKDLRRLLDEGVENGLDKWVKKINTE